MKIACVYTGINADLMTNVENEVKAKLTDCEVQFYTFTNPGVLAEVVENGRVTKNVYKEMYNMYMASVNHGVDIIYNICSSVGDVASAAIPSFKLIGVPLVKIDQAMADYAVNKTKRIGVIATLKTTLEPTKRQIIASAQKIGKKDIDIKSIVIDGAFGKSPKELEDMLLDGAKKIAEEVDIIILAQASMAACENVIQKETSIETLSSPRFGAAALKEVCG